MTNYLGKTLNPNITFHVKDITYYPDLVKKNFICRFNVTMHIGNNDTAGIVAAIISQDFQQVTRNQ